MDEAGSDKFQYQFTFKLERVANSRKLRHLVSVDELR